MSCDLNCAKGASLAVTKLHTASRLVMTAIALITLLAHSQTATASGKLRTVALSGDVFSEEEDGDHLVFSGLVGSFSSAVINNSGETAFEAAISTRSGLANASGIVQATSTNEYSAVAFANDPITDSSDSSTVGIALRDPTINDRGSVAFLSSEGLVVKDGGELTIASQSEDSDLIPGKRVASSSSTFFGPSLTENGQVASLALIYDDVPTSESDSGLLLSDPSSGTSEFVTRSGESISDLGGLTVRSVDHFAINNHGQVVLSAHVSETVDASVTRHTILRGGPTSLTTVVIEGAPFSALGPDVTISPEISLRPAFNDRGQTAFPASLLGGDFESVNNSALFTEGGGAAIELIARSGTRVTDGDRTITIRHIRDSSPLINSQGQVLFQASFEVDNAILSDPFGFFRHDPGAGLQLVFNPEDPLPNVEDGVTLFRSPARLSEFSINSRGQTAFFHRLSDGTSAIFAQDLAGELQLIARTGQLINVSDDPLNPQLRGITSLEFIGGTGNEDGRRSAFNDRGELVFSARFTDGTEGVFVSSLVAIPEPVSLAILCVALVCAVSSRSARLYSTASE